MNKTFFKLFLSVTFIFTGFLFVGVEKADAACTVTSATFRPTADGQSIQVPPTGWYNDTNPPFVYIDFETTGCVNDVFTLSITHNHSMGGGLSVQTTDSNITGFSNRPIVNVPADNFTIAARTGDDRCNTNQDPDCRYYIRINSAPMGTNFNMVSNLRYMCDGVCDNKDWQWMGFLPYQAVHQDDVPGDPTGGSQGTGVGTGGTDIEINILNPIGPSNMTLVDFIQKVINFALTIGIPIIAIAIIYSGLLFVTARGNDQQLETAKNAFTYAVIGGALLLGAFIFAKLIKETIESIAMISNYFG